MTVHSIITTSTHLINHTRRVAFMTSAPRLGGFKVLKDVARFSPIFPRQPEFLPSEFCRILAREKINLPYITCVHDDHSWGLTVMVDATDGAKTTRLIEENFGSIYSHNSQSAILSVFPHKNDPEIVGRLLEAFHRGDVEVDGLANSPSAFSVVLREEALSPATNALFGPFSFSAYRTPADWKLAQKGKERLYREVVASYQEKRPRVYGLECHEQQELLHLKAERESLGELCSLFNQFSELGLSVTFLATAPCDGERAHLVFCLPVWKRDAYTKITGRTIAGACAIRRSSVCVFSMNGPHFGDRYGIVGELLEALGEGGIDLLALSCTIASIVGVIPSNQTQRAIEVIQGCFEVPSVSLKGPASL